MLSKKILVFILVIIQASLLLVFIIKSRILRLNHFSFRDNMRSVWTKWKIDSESVEPEAEVFGSVDLNDEQFRWLHQAAKNVTRITEEPTVYIPTTTINVTTTVEETTFSNYSLESKILKPVNFNHEKGEVFLLVLVTSAPKSLERRELIRKTWAKASLPLQGGLKSSYTTNFTYYVVFMLGISGDQELDRALEDEAEKYGDILRAPSYETYRNIVDKVWYAFEWAQQYEPKYILKVDDDIYVRIPRFVKWLAEGKVPSRLYGGYVHYRAYISRNPKDKHYVSRTEYKRRFFPNYCAGPCYTFSGELLDEFLELSKEIPRFKVEDAYLGLIAKRAGVKPFNIGGTLFVWDRSLSRTVHKWTDQRLSRVICLGDSLTLEALTYIHERFMSIDSS